MSLSNFLRGNPVWALLFVLGLGGLVPEASPTETRISITGAQGGGALLPSRTPGTRLSIFETDSWRHSLDSGILEPVPQVPLPSSWDRTKDLLRGANFTPDAYLERIASLRNTYSRQRDILMYYGGIRRRPKPEGLNFNAWSGPDLRKLRALECRPFIGLETMDRQAVRYLIWRLKEAGYGRMDRIYVRVGAEPAHSGYEKTPAAYRKAFARTSDYINAMNRRLGMNIHIVFAGTNSADFTQYQPEEYLFDEIGYDLYVTPENKAGALKQLQALARRYPYKRLVIPEFGIATQGPAQGWRKPRSGYADPIWAADALGDVLQEMSRHPAGVEEITVFSVNVPARIRDRRWNWAWTPRMYDLLKEWEASPSRWRKDGFHRYDPLSYPVGRDVLFLNRPDSRIVYRKLPTFQSPGVPLFLEVCCFWRHGEWMHRSRTVYFNGSETRPH